MRVYNGVVDGLVDNKPPEADNVSYNFSQASQRWNNSIYTDFYRATLCYSAVYAVVVCLSVRPSQAGTAGLPKRQNV